MISQTQVIQDISLLYELALSIGNSLDTYENCENFAKVLIARKNIAALSIYVNESYLPYAQNKKHTLLYANPLFRIKATSIPNDHLIFKLLAENNGMYSVAADNPIFKEISLEYNSEKGSIAILELPSVGILRFWSIAKKTPYSITEMNQISGVVKKFASSLIACFHYRQSIEETSKRLKQQKIAEENENTVRQVINTALDAVITIDQHGNIVEWNKQAELTFGYTKEEAKGKPMSELIVPERYRAMHHSGLKRYLKTGEGKVINNRIEITAINRHKEEFPIELAISPFKQGDETFFSSYLRDITVRKQAEAKREALLKELEEANKELKDFAYIVSHDLKAPLRGIGTLTNWISEDYKDVIDDEGKEKLKLLHSRVTRMHGFINGILQYSRIGRFKENRESINITELVHNTIDALEIPPHITVEIKPDFPKVVGEKTRISQVFQNLISNAIKYTNKEKGELKVYWEESKTHWHFFVEDNGDGIDKKYHDKIFQIFQTLQTRDSFESTGIGLTIVKKIVEMHGGKVLISSEPNKGSIFEFTIKK